MICKLPLVLLIYPNNLLVQESVPMYGLFASPLHGLVDMGGDSLVSGLSLVCLPQSFCDLASEASLDRLRLAVQKLYLFLYSASSRPPILIPDFNCILTFNSSWAINNMSVRRELNARCCLFSLTESFRSNRPMICSSCRMQVAIRDSLVGSGVRRPCLAGCPYFARKPSQTRDRGVWCAKCDRARWVTVVTTLGSKVQDSSSPSSFPSSPSSPSSWAQSMTSAPEVRSHLLWFPLTGNLSFGSSPHLRCLKTLS